MVNMDDLIAASRQKRREVQGTVMDRLLLSPKMLRLKERGV